MTVTSSIADTLRGRHLLVTGATGFVGKVWLSHLLTHVPEIGRITLLVRGSRKQSAAARVAELIDTTPVFRHLKDQHGEALGAFLRDRIDVLDADLTRPGCGLDENTVQHLVASVDAVVHIAGLTDFQPDPRKGVPANVDGTAHVADLARRTPHRRLLHVSTCYVAGTPGGEVPEALTPGVSPLGVRFSVEDERQALRLIDGQFATAPDRIDAAMVRARRLGWPNLYTFTKGLAEHLLAADDLDLVILRPSVVECARTFPFVGWNEGLNTSAPIMWFCGTAFPALPSAGTHRFDIVPVDAVARNLTVALAAQLRGEARPVYQVATSHNNPTTFARIVELTALGKRRHAARAGGRPAERLTAHLDAAPVLRDDLGMFRPETVESVLGWVRARIERVEKRELKAPLARLRDRARDRLRRARQQVVKQQRAMAQLQRMLEVYQPFLHDHDWRFRADHVDAAQARLLPEDAAFRDDLRSLCWRSYWLDVQYPGVVRWSFPLMDGRDAPTDPPSDPALTLDAPASRLQGAA